MLGPLVVEKFNSMAAVTNLFLESLSSPVQESILSAATHVDLPSGTLLEEEETRPKYAYFLNEGIASVVASDGRGSAEVALIGIEGFIGAYSLLGPALPLTRTSMQIAGSGYGVRFDALQRLFSSSDELKSAVLLFAQRQALHISQVAACVQLHDVQERLARWILMARDRVGGDDIQVTHESLAQILGVHRPTVTKALGALVRAGLVETQRSSMKIVNRDGLIRAACACYPITRRLLDSLYAPRTASGTD